jgi:hypothetical protein
MMEDMEKREVFRFLQGIEDGGLPIADAYNVLRHFDPLLSYFLLRFLREKHPINDESTGAGKRLLELVSTYEDVAKLTKAPKGDEAMVEWFNDSFNMRQFFNRPEEFVQLIVDKLEG